MRLKNIGLLLAVAFLAAGCAPELTYLQRRGIESRELAGKFDDAMKATLQVFQDYGYVIKQTDYQTGVIHGETGIKRQFWGGVMTNYQITATIEQFGDDRIKERLSLIRNEKTSSEYGTHENSDLIDDPQLFQKMYDDIQKEMFIRKNLSK